MRKAVAHAINDRGPLGQVVNFELRDRFDQQFQRTANLSKLAIKFFAGGGSDNRGYRRCELLDL